MPKLDGGSSALASSLVVAPYVETVVETAGSVPMPQRP